MKTRDLLRKHLLQRAKKQRRDEHFRLKRQLQNIQPKFVPSYRVLINILYSI